MKLSYPIFENPIIFKENKINVLVIENQKLFVKLINELLHQINGFDGKFVLSLNFKEIEINKNMDMLIDPFSLDINQKKVITKLYSHLKNTALDSDFYIDTKAILSEIMQYAEKISQTSQFPLAYANDIDIVSVFKILDLKIEICLESLVEKILDYCSVVQEFCGITCMVFVNLKCYLSDEELEQFYRIVSYKKIFILLLENTVREQRFEIEELHIIDSDLCEII